MGGNGSVGPHEEELARRLGEDYITETPPPGARIMGEHGVEEYRPEEVQRKECEEAD